MIKRFRKLFSGNDRSFGQFYPSTKESVGGEMKTKEGSATDDDFKNHLEGKIGIGIVPVTDEGKSVFGVIDIDAHKDDESIDLIKLEERVRVYDLPLVICRSKSGGAHCYIFTMRPLKSALIRKSLSKWATLLGYNGSEIFPKQSELPAESDGSDRMLGNWINLPMFGALSGDTDRYAIINGKIADIDKFLDYAESKRCTAAQITEKMDIDHADAPPCIQRMIAEGIEPGYRNQGMYNIAVYLKQAKPMTWMDEARALNQHVFKLPLSSEEVTKTLKSIARKDYRYKCQEEPCRSKCRSEICITRKFGITPREQAELSGAVMPKFANLRKVDTQPPLWLLDVDSQTVQLSTEDLLNYKTVRKKIVESLMVIPPPIQVPVWEGIIRGLIKEAEVLEAPEDASSLGQLHNKLNEFLLKADLKADPDDQTSRQKLSLGIPVVQIFADIKVVMFKGQGFIDFLKKTRGDEIKGPALWLALKQLGVSHTKIRIDGAPKPIWYVPVEEISEPDTSSARIESEF